jgi:DNA-nicking Smr family endonuclease
MTGPGDDPPPDDQAPVELPIDGTLDLHTFHPREVKELLPEYLAACAEKGIFEVRVVHGKGTGTLRRTVEALLGRIPLVKSWRPAGEGAGGWGATLVSLDRASGSRSPGGQTGNPA